jgi:hypothetical protein
VKSHLDHDPLPPLIADEEDNHCLSELMKEPSIAVFLDPMLGLGCLGRNREDTRAACSQKVRTQLSVFGPRVLNQLVNLTRGRL